MKIALISNMYPSENSPAFGVFVKNTENLLSENGIETFNKAVICGRKKSLAKLFSYASLYIKIIYIFFNKNIELIYIHFPLQTSPLLLILNKFSLKKLVLNIHGSELNQKSIFYNSFRKLLYQSNLVVVPSNSFKQKLIKLSKLNPNKIFVYPSGGVESSVFYEMDKAKIQQELGLHNEFVCSFISSIIKNKGWETFVEATKILKPLNLKFMVVGNGECEIEFKEKVKAYALESQFVFFDKQKQSELAKYFNASNVFIFPTKKESLGLVGVEAMSCGIPVIASNIDATSEYVKDGINGFIFEMGSAKDLAEKIEKFYHSTVKDNFKMEALKTASKFDSKNCSFALAEKLKQL